MPAKHSVMNGLAAQRELENYQAGYKNGRADNALGVNRSVVALNAGPGMPGYSSGYYDGYHGLAGPHRPWHKFGSHSGICLECGEHMDSPTLSEVCIGKDGRE